MPITTSPKIPLLELTDSFDSIVSPKDVSEILFKGPETAVLVTQAQDVARDWQDDVLRENSGKKVRTGV